MMEGKKDIINTQNFIYQATSVFNRILEIQKKRKKRKVGDKEISLSFHLNFSHDHSLNYSKTS
jgi:hypothetical protein